MNNIPWVEKYRPQTIETIISHKDILNTLYSLINKKNFPHVIFYGPSGTGKTTTILACAKKMYGESYNNMVLELNGSDDRGINVVREQIKDFSSSEMFTNIIFNKNKKKHKLVILDEADSMTHDAQFALRRVIENFSSTTRFCLICNYSTKIITSLQSRCIIFRFSLIPEEEHLKHLTNIVKLENINIDENVLIEIIKISEGDLRKSLNILQSLSISYHMKHINLNNLYINLAYPDSYLKKKIVDTIINNNIKDAFLIIKKMEQDNNIAITDILNELVSYIINESNFSNFKIAKILNKYSDIEFFLSGNVNLTIQLSSIISIFKCPL
jgi:replication factor C subunit 3/5